MQLSPYQQAVIEAVIENLKQIKLINTSPSALVFASQLKLKKLLIEALAGAGKSTMLWLVAKTLSEGGITPDECCVLVFGKKNQLDLQSKFESKVGAGWGESVRTLHSLGYELYRDALRVPHKAVKMQGYKYSRIGEQLGWLTKDSWQGKLTEDPEAPAIVEERDFLKLIDLLRSYCYVPSVENVEVLNKRHKLGIKDAVVVSVAAREVLDKGEREACHSYVIDTEDMCWLPYQWRKERGMSAAIAHKQKQLRWIALDECQDTNTLQVEMIDLLLGDQAFLTAVGDRNQAVYLFRGCLSDGMQTIKERFDCTVLDLPVNYRCGTVHLDMIRESFPHIPIQPHDSAPRGEIRCITFADFLSIFEDMHLSYFGTCRKNAPMVLAAITLLAAGKPVVIKDKGIGSRLKNQIKQITTGRGRYSPDTFPGMLEAYSQERRTTLMRFPDWETKVADHEDMMAAVLALFEAYEPKTLKSWEEIVDKIFKESGYSPISFYTIHSGKGGEGQVSFVLYPEEMPLTWRGQSDEEAQQEENLCYVASSRTLADGTPGSGIFYLVLRDNADGKVNYPTWLPPQYQKLWKESVAVAV